MESWSIIGVNCFILISGYFGIRPTVKGIVNFLLWCGFYSIIIYSIYAFVEPKSYHYSDIISSFAVLSHTDLWFIPAYFSLYLIAPLINHGTSSITKKEFIWLLVALTFINVYLGWYWEGKINPNGYNIMQLIYIYIIGRYIHHHVPKRTKYRRKYLMVYFISFCLIVISSFFCKSIKTYAYNSPFVICSSIFFFLTFTTLRLRSKNINIIASSAFAVYLIHKMPPVWLSLKNFLIGNTANLSPIAFALYWLLFIMIIFSSCITIDKLRIFIMKPITKALTDHIKRFI